MCSQRCGFIFLNMCFLSRVASCSTQDVFFNSSSHMLEVLQQLSYFGGGGSVFTVRSSIAELRLLCERCNAFVHSLSLNPYL